MSGLMEMMGELMDEESLREVDELRHMEDPERDLPPRFEPGDCPSERSPTHEHSYHTGSKSKRHGLP